ncbi:gamma-glutamyltransferase [Paraburkholderia edwinii]|uniref:gamma-glutamyltransferase n=1 Tax=Paraburkholderia edwinii TaxID=2861782 RepID=UPI001FE8A044|nr:gamma-glutamyltransferase [Paraburkholderia edwinii]
MPPTTLDARVARHALSGNRADNTGTSARASGQRARKTLHAAALAALLGVLATCVVPVDAKTAPAKNVFDASAVATPDRYSADTAQQIFAQGGNAVDAAVAIAFTLAVTRPDAGNLGGGGFMTLQIDGKPYFLDYSAQAPQRATRDMYVDDKGNVVKNMSSIGFRAAGVPGTVEGLWEAQKRFGKLKWKQVLAPAIRYATDGFVVDASLQKRRDDAAAKFAGKTNFNAYFAGLKSGATFRQPELAQTLGRIADDGGREFYEGQTAELIAKQMYGHGMISKTDLTQYKALWRDPLAADWNGYRIVTAPPPSSGGIALIQLLKMKADLKPQFAGVELNSAPYIQLVSQMEDRVFADRTKYAADPDATPVPVGKLTDDAYLAQRAGEVKELWAQQKAAEEKAAREKEEQEKAAREKAEQEKAAQEKAAQEKAEQEKAQQAAAQASGAAASGASGVQGSAAAPAGASQPGVDQAGAGQSNTAVQPSAGQSNPGQPNATQSGTGQANAGQSNSNQAGVASSSSGQPNANQPGAASSTSGHANAVAASASGAPQANAPQPQPAQAKPAQPAQAQPDGAAASTNSASGDTSPAEKPQTTHFSVVDKWGNAVSNTYTLSGSFGSGVVVDGGGFLLNDAMDDFVAKPGAGMDEANTIAPGRRPVSSMTPTIVLKDGKVALVIGTPGGSRIFTTIFQVMADLYDFGMPPANALAAMRFHHQALPPKAIYWEPYHPITGDLAQQLQKLGYTPEGQDFNGDVQMIRIDGTTPQPAADPRGVGVARVFP